ncbi:DUF1036 domain-containing protein [Pyxidicoccus xibeiensis]|uniref:DUF1036 domain-containing protein n=1 Tax=Pyxidicoccus xibeiensis TaxID=2906759 RepID=UPI0020A78341|nr:DUF1036 domain-containing protein [Pyxidicoccus xibeiensis]MCP3139388.1 DUF1036 domain-containing protein [Pyxidicoccus xibeiensis]
MSTRKLVMAFAAAAGLGFAGPAHAWVQFCNGTSVTIWTAYSWYDASCVPEDGSSWRKVGWWDLTPGQCKIVYGPAISNTFSYYYAEGGGLVWSGDFFTCTPWNAFNWCDNTCDASSRNLGYRELNTGGAQNYTLTFNP